MHEIGNARAAEIYGGFEHRPSDYANDSIWLQHLRDKYELQKWAKHDKNELKKEQKSKKSFQSKQENLASSVLDGIPNNWGGAMDDFAQVSEFSKAAAPKKNLFGKKNHDPVAKKESVEPPDLLDDSPAAAPDAATTTRASRVLPPSSEFFSEFGL